MPRGGMISAAYREKGAPVSDAKQTHVRFKLRDLTIIDQFICYSEYGMEAEPAHKVLVHAKGDYDLQSDKLELDGQQIELDSIQIQAVSTKEDCLKSNARRGHISIYMIDHVFSSFVELLRGGTQTGEIVMMLSARPLDGHPEILRISFDGIDLTRKAGAPINDQTGGDLAHLSAQLRTNQTLLVAIAVMFGLMLLHFLFR